LEFYHLRLGSSMSNVTLAFKANRNGNVLVVELQDLASRLDEPIDYLSYSTETKKLIHYGGKQVREAILKFPDELIEESRKFLEKMFDIYVLTALAVRYVFL